MSSQITPRSPALRDLIIRRLGPAEEWTLEDAEFFLELHSVDTSPPSEALQNSLNEIRAARELQGEDVSLIYAMSWAQRRSLFPESPENQNDDFQAGYLIGLQAIFSEHTYTLDPITQEFHRRNQIDSESFRTWKQGFHAGQLATAVSIASKQST
jgi:hypothetical protein